MDDPERLAEIVRLERSAGSHRSVRLSGGQSAVVLIVVLSTHPLSTVGTDQGALSETEEAVPSHGEPGEGY